MGDKIDQLYDALKADGAVEKSRENFRSFMLAKGKQGYQNRKQLYEALKADGAVSSPTYEEFGKRLGLVAVKDVKASEQTKQPAPVRMQGKPEKMTTYPVPSAADEREPMQTYRVDALETGAKEAPIPERQQAYKPTWHDEIKLRQALGNANSAIESAGARTAAMEKRAEHTNPLRNDDVVKGDFKPNAETGAFEQTYITPQGNESFDRKGAEIEAAVDKAMYDDSVLGQMARARAELAELHEQANRRGRLVQEQYEKEHSGYWSKVFEGAKVGRGMLTALPSVVLDSDAEFRALRTAIRQREEQIKTLEEQYSRETSGDGEFLSGVKDFGRGFGRTVGSLDTWDFGQGAMSDASAMVTATKNDRYKTEGQRAAEQKMMAALYEKETAEGRYSSGTLYGWGAMTGHMPRFMAEFGMTLGGGAAINTFGKLGAKGAVKLVGRQALKEMAGQGVKGYVRANGIKGAAKIAGKEIITSLGTTFDDLLLRAPMMTNTIQGARTAADIADRKVGDVVANGDGTYNFKNNKSWSSAVWQAEANSIVENASEMFGTHLEGFGKKMSNVFGPGRISRILSKTNAEGLQRMMEATGKQFNRLGVSDYIGETTEELYGQLLRTALNLDDAYMENADGTRTNLFATGKFYSDIYCGMAISMGMMGVGKHALTGINYAHAKHQVNKAGRRASALFTEGEWDALREKIDNTSNDDIGKVLRDIGLDKTLTEEQKAATAEYVGAMMGMRGFNLADLARMRSAGVNQDAQNMSDAYMRGYNARAPRDRNDAKHMYEVMEERLRANLNGQEGMDADAAMAAIEADPVEALLNTPEQMRQPVIDYINAKMVYDGMIRSVQDNIEEEMAASDAMIDTRVHRQTGAIQGAVMTNGDRAVYVINGELAVNDDGSIDHRGSDKSVLVRDAETGVVEFADPYDMARADAPVDAEQQKIVARMQIRQKIAEEAANQIDGRLSFAAGERYELKLGDEITQVTVVGPAVDKQGTPIEGLVTVEFEDGSRTDIEQSTVQQMADDAARQRAIQQTQQGEAAEEGEVPEAEPSAVGYKVNDTVKINVPGAGEMEATVTALPDSDGYMRVTTSQPIGGEVSHRLTPAELDALSGRATSNAEVDDSTDSADKQENDTESSLNESVSALSKIPLDANGKPDFMAAESADVAWDALMEKTRNEASAKGFADNMVVRMQKILQKAKQVKPMDTADIDTFAESEERRKAAIKDAEKRLKKWQEIAATPQRRVEEEQMQTSTNGFRGRPLTEQEATELVDKMESTAEEAHIIELTPENWIAQFGEDGKVDTPMGVVKLGENQFMKLYNLKRAGYFGMMYPTLSNPDVVIEKSAPANGAERDSKLLFVKTFTKPNGGRVVHFESITVKRDGMEVSISSHEAEAKDIKKDMQKEKILHISERLSLSSEWSLTEAPQKAEGPDLVPTSDNSDSKGNANLADKQESGAESSPIGAVSVLSKIPLDAKGKPDFTAAESADVAWDALMEKTRDKETAKEFADNMIIRLQKMLQKAKQVKPMDTADIDTFAESEGRRNAAIKETEERLKKWQEIVATPQRRAEEEQMQATAKASKEPSITEQEAKEMIAAMEARAETASEIELTPENWTAQFGEDGVVSTPIGEVKMGDNQYLKMARQGRAGKLGMVKPTLENPDIVVEELRPAVSGKSERDTSFIFIKAFRKSDGERYYYFTSVTVQKDGKEVIISNQEKSINRISRLLQDGTIVWIKSDGILHPKSQAKEPVPSSDPNSPTVADNQAAMLGIDSHAVSDSKDNANSADKQENDAESSPSGAESALSRIPLDPNGKPDFMAAESADVAWDALMEKTRNEASAKGFADNMVARVQKALQKAKQVKPMDTDDIDAFAEGEERRKAAIKDAEERLKKWQEIAATPQRRAEEAKSGEGGSEVLHQEQAADRRGSAEAAEGGPAQTGGTRADNGAAAQAAEQVEAGADGNTTQQRIAEAEATVNTEPTDAQKEAGNYKKGHVRIDGLEVTIEQPKGSVRRGRDASGKEWESTMHHTYGYIRGTEGKDGDHIDMFLSDNPEQGEVFVVDQYNTDGSFDEHKVMYGFASAEEARRAYLSNYEKGWENTRRIEVTGLSKDEFKKWIDSSKRKTKPAAEYARFRDREAGAAAFAGRLGDVMRSVMEAWPAPTIEQERGKRVSRFEAPTEEQVREATQQFEKLLGEATDEELLGIRDAFMAQVDRMGLSTQMAWTMLTCIRNAVPAERKMKLRQMLMARDRAGKQDDSPARLHAAEGARQTAEGRAVYEATKGMLEDAGIAVEEVSDEQAQAMLGDKKTPGNEISAQKNARQANEGNNITSATQKSLEQAVSRIKDWIANGKRGVKFTLQLPGRTMVMVRRVMGRDFDSHNITANSLAHILRNHGENGAKLTEGSIPIRKEDLLLIPYIMIAPDRIEKASMDASGRESLRFYKNLSNGYIVVVEKEYKNSPDDMETITMWAEMSSEAINARHKTAVPDTHVQNAILSTDVAKIQKDARIAIESDRNPQFSIRTYHGTGADFEEFDFSYMGEGEGNQSFGWGGYVTEVKGIGRTYATNVGGSTIIPKIQKAKGNIDQVKSWLKGNQDWAKYERKGRKHLRELQKELKAAIKEDNAKDIEFYKELVELQEESLKEENHKALVADKLTQIETYESEIASLEEELKNSRHLYTIKIPNDTGSNYLDWDGTLTDEQGKNLTAQAEKESIKIDFYGEAIGMPAYLQNMGDGIEGFQIYKALTRALGSDRAASEFLSRAGLVGIKYAPDRGNGGRSDGKKNYVIFQESDMEISDHVRFLRTARGEVYGWTVGGKVFLNRDAMNPETPLHEYTHLWDAMVRKENPELWERGKELMKQTPAWKEVVEDPNYADIAADEDAVASEVHARLTGQQGAETMERMVEEARAEGAMKVAEAVTLREQLKEWLRDMFASLKSTLEQWSGRDLSALTLEQFNAMPLRDLAAGMNPTDIVAQEGQAQYSRGKRKVMQSHPSLFDMPGMDDLDFAEYITNAEHEAAPAGREMTDGERLLAIQALEPIEIGHNNMSKSELQEVYRKLPTVKKDGREVEFYHSAFKKIYKNGGLFGQIVPVLDEVLEQSVLAYSEKDNLGGTVRPDGTVHKAHPNVDAFDNYVGKVALNGKEYYVRTTVQSSEKSTAGTHSFMVTQVDVYENTANGLSLPITTRARVTNDGIVDTKLQQFFERASSELNQREDEELMRDGSSEGKAIEEAWNSELATAREAAAEQERMRQEVTELAAEMGLDNVDILEDASTLTGRRRNAKGFYNRRTGKITVVLSNNLSVEDAKSTLLHEAVGHHGLRKLLGERFTQMLDSLYAKAPESVRRRIAQKAARMGWDFRTATEEYLAEMAEDGSFMEADRGWWNKMKRMLRSALRAAGIDVAVSDNEMRYLLWRSYRNLTESSQSMMGAGEDIAMQQDLKVGEFAEAAQATPRSQAEAARLRETNRRFNQQLEEYEAGNLPERHRFDLGMPSKYLQSAGFPNKPISMRKSLLEKKSALMRHPFSAKDIKGLVNALQKPLAIFSYSKENMRNVIVEVEKDGKQFLIGVTLDYKAGDVECNSISGIFPKENIEWLKWIQDGKAIRIDQKDKVQDIIDSQRTTNTVESERIGLNLDSAAKIVENFENPAIEEQNYNDEEDADVLLRQGEEMFGDSEQLQDRVLNAKIALAARFRSDMGALDAAVRGTNARLSDLRRSLTGQKEYDRARVKRLTDLVQTMMRHRMLQDMNAEEEQRVQSAISNALAMRDVNKAVEKLMDVMTSNQLRTGELMLQKLIKVAATKVDTKGMEAQALLDLRGQRVMEAFKQSYHLPAETFTKEGELTGNCVAYLMQQARERLDSADDAIRGNAEAEYAGLALAYEYAQQIGESKEEEQEIRRQMQESGLAKREERKDKEAHREFMEAAYERLRTVRMERAEAYREMAMRLKEVIAGGKERATAFRAAERDRIRDIQHDANRDMQGRPANAHRKDSAVQKWANNGLVRFFLKPLATFDQMLRMFGRNSVNGEGYLYDRFMNNGWLPAKERYYQGREAAMKELDDKVSEVMGRKMRWSGLYSMERKMPKHKVSIMDADGPREILLTQGNLLYIYMANKMEDGKMKLRKMGIREEDVAAIAKELDPRFVKLADWLQEEYLPKRRNGYNAVHERLTGAPMGAIENYFPLRVLSNARTENVDVGQPLNNAALPSTTTGSVIKRRTNSHPLDIANADAFSVTVENVDEMERWAAFAEFNRDLNTLLSYKRFRNQVMGMASMYGGGKLLWNNFRDCCRIAAGTYRPRSNNDSIDELFLNVAKGVTTAKITGRIYTALKQFLSFPAYFSEASTAEIFKSIFSKENPWRWAMEELPVFRERWLSRQSGDSRLKETDLDWRWWKTRLGEAVIRHGMSPNAFVDALTVSIGAHAIYKTKRKRYLKYGFSEEKADEMAKRDATISFNQTQQSSEDAFMSAMQLDRTTASVAATVFRNSSMGYQRQLMDSMRTLKRMMFEKGYREKSIAFMTGKYRTMGLDEAKAQEAAEREYARAKFREAARFAIFGFVMQFAWNLGGCMVYLLAGDDDDKKEDMLTDAAIHAAFGGLEGFTVGCLLSEAGNMWVQGKDFKNYDPELLPMLSDAKKIWQHFDDDAVAGANDLVNLLIQSGAGVNPQTITDVAVAIYDACNGDLGLAKESGLLIMRILAVPQSQIDALYLDEIKMSGAEAAKLSPQQLAERYAKYKRLRGAPLTSPAYSDDAREEREEKYAKRFLKMAKGRYKEGRRKDMEAYFNMWDEEYESTKAQIDSIRDAYANDLDAQEHALGEFAATGRYERSRRYDRVRKKIAALEKEWAKAKTPEEMQAVDARIAGIENELQKMMAGDENAVQNLATDYGLNMEVNAPRAQ